MTSKNNMQKCDSK